MRRREFIRELVDAGCYLKRHGGRHDLFANPKTGRIAPVPRHAEVMEVKYTDAPRLTPSMRIALRDLKLDELVVLFPGKQSFPLAPRIRAVGFQAFLK